MAYRYLIPNTNQPYTITRIWHECPTEDEPLWMDKDLTHWRANPELAEPQATASPQMKEVRQGAACRAPHPAAKPCRRLTH